MTNLKNHPGKWLSPAAAASLERLEAAHGVIGVNSAGRTVAEQQDLINRYYVIGGPANRPPNLFAPYRPAAGGNHVKNGGQAIDTNNISHMLKYGPEFGWFQNFAYDPVHFEYDASRDKHAGGSAPINHSLQVTKDRQNWLNSARGEKLKVDGQNGPATKAAVKRYETFLRKYGYKGAIDGIWGNGVQAAHSVYYAARKKAAADKASGVNPTVKNQQTFLILARGEKIDADGKKGPATTAAFKRYQQFLRKYGYNGAIDGNWGDGTQKAHSKFYAEWKKSH